MKSVSTQRMIEVTENWAVCIEDLFRANPSDKRIPVVVLLATAVDQAMGAVFGKVDKNCLGGLVVFGGEPQPMKWPSSLRYVEIQQDELLQSNGCLCCSLRSELATSLSQLFLDVLRRQQRPVAAVVLVTGAHSADALVQTLKHAPFLGQRYRLAVCLPSASA